MPPIKRGRALLPEGLTHLEHPFRLLVSGRSLSGKTTLVVNVVKMLLPFHQWENIILISPTASQPTWNPIRARLTQEITRLDDEILFKICKRQRPRDGDVTESVLLLIDDSSAEEAANRGRRGGMAMLGNNARWLNISVIIMSQSQPSISPSFRDNAEGIIIFQTLKEDEFDYLRKERNPYIGRDKTIIQQIYLQATAEPGSFYFQANTRSGVRSYKNFDQLFELDGEDKVTLKRLAPQVMMKHRRPEKKEDDFIKVKEEEKPDDEERPGKLAVLHSYWDKAKGYSPF